MKTSVQIYEQPKHQYYPWKGKQKRRKKKKKKETLDSTRTRKLLVHTDVRCYVIKGRLNPDHTLWIAFRVKPEKHLKDTSNCPRLRWWRLPPTWLCDKIIIYFNIAWMMWVNSDCNKRIPVSKTVDNENLVLTVRQSSLLINQWV